MNRILPAFYAVIAISVGSLVLLGYFVPQVAGFQLLLLDWAVILAGVALLVGTANLFSVHFARVRTRSKGYLYSLVTLVSMLAILLLGVAGLTGAITFTMNAILVPVEISLMAVLVVTLAYASMRLLRDRLEFKTIVFLVTALLVLSGTVSLPILLFGDELLPMVSQIISQVLAAGGARGLLLGIALGTLTTGLRILFGADRPYGGK